MKSISYSIISLLIITIFNAIGIIRAKSVEGKINHFGTGVLLILFYIALAIVGKGG